MSDIAQANQEKLTSEKMQLQRKPGRLAEYLDEIPKGALKVMGAALGGLILSLGTTAMPWVLNLAPSDTTILTIRLWLLIVGSGTLFAMGWFLFVRTRRKLHFAEKRLQDSRSVHFKVSDDYEFVTESGFWIERSTGLRVCAKCILPPTKIVSPLFEALGSDFDGDPAMVWRCGHCGTDYWVPQRREKKPTPDATALDLDYNGDD